MVPLRLTLNPRYGSSTYQAACNKAKRQGVKALIGWLNHFRKLLARHKKLEHSLVTLNHLAAARRVPERGIADKYYLRMISWSPDDLTRRPTDITV